MIAIQMSPLAKLFAKIKAEMVANGTPFADSAAEAAFRTWLQAAWLDSGCTQDFLCLSQPASSTTIQLDVRVATSGQKVEIWWGDGASDSYSPGTSSYTACAHTYGAGALRPVVVLGRVKELRSEYSDGRTAFGGRIATMRSLTFLYVVGNNTLSGSVAGLTSLTVLSVHGSNTITGSVAGLTSLTYLYVGGSNTITGSVAGLTSLTFLSVHGSNTLSGSVAGLTSLTFLYVGGNNTLSGSVAGLTALTILSVSGNNTISGSVASLTALTYLSVAGSNTLSGSVAGLTALTYLYVGGSNTITGWELVAANATGLCYFVHGGLTVLSSEQVNAVLAGFWANRDAPKPLSERAIDLGKDTPTPNAAPTGQGLADKAALQAYRSPNNTGPDVWTVITN